MNTEITDKNIADSNHLTCPDLCFGRLLGVRGLVTALLPRTKTGDAL